MKLARTFTVDRTAAHASGAACAYLLGIGYRTRAGAKDCFDRGSLLGSLTSFSPRDWRAKAAVVVRSAGPDRATVRLDLDVNTTGQMVTQAEREYWDAELAGFERAVATGELRTAEITGAAEEIASSGKKIISGQVVQILAGAVVTLVTAVILSQCRF